MKIILSLVAFSVVTACPDVRCAFAATPSMPIALWPGPAPGDTGDIGEEKDMSKPNEGLVAGKPLIRLGNVSKPTITVYPAPKDKATGTAVVICPGGGYGILAMDLEGSEICEWFNSIGVTAVLLKYRVPARPGRERYAAPLQDAQRAVGLVRQHANDWGIDPNRIGILGFSAGSHLTVVLCGNYEKRTYDAIDDADKVSCRPDFALLIYPSYFTTKRDVDKLAPEINVTAHNPPSFLVETQDDDVQCSLTYYAALKAAKVYAEMHLYPVGGHGYGLRPSSNTVATWPQRAEQWLGSLGMLERKK